MAGGSSLLLGVRLEPFFQGFFMDTNVVVLVGEQYDCFVHLGVSLIAALGVVGGLLLARMCTVRKLFVFGLLAGSVGSSAWAVPNLLVYGCTSNGINDMRAYNGSFTWDAGNWRWFAYVTTNSVEGGCGVCSCGQGSLPHTHYAWDYGNEIRFGLNTHMTISPSGNPADPCNAVPPAHDGGGWTPATYGLGIYQSGCPEKGPSQPLDCGTNTPPMEWPGYWTVVVFEGVTNCLWNSYAGGSDYVPDYDYGPWGNWVFDGLDCGSMPWDADLPCGEASRWRWDGIPWDGSLMPGAPFPWSEGSEDGGGFDPDLPTNRPPYDPPGGVSNEPPLILTNQTPMAISNGWSAAAVKQALQSLEAIYGVSASNGAVAHGDAVAMLAGMSSVAGGMSNINSTLIGIGGTSTGLLGSLNGSAFGDNPSYTSNIETGGLPQGVSTQELSAFLADVDSATNTVSGIFSTGLGWLSNSVSLLTFPSVPKESLLLIEVPGNAIFADGFDIRYDFSDSEVWGYMREFEKWFLYIGAVFGVMGLVRKAIA